MELPGRKSLIEEIVETNTADVEIIEPAVFGNERCFSLSRGITRNLRKLARHRSQSRTLLQSFQAALFPGYVLRSFHMVLCSVGSAFKSGIAITNTAFGPDRCMNWMPRAVYGVCAQKNQDTEHRRFFRLFFKVYPGSRLIPQSDLLKFLCHDVDCGRKYV